MLVVGTRGLFAGTLYRFHGEPRRFFDADFRPAGPPPRQSEGAMTVFMPIVRVLSLGVLFSLLVPIRAAAAPYVPDANHARDEIPDLYKWDLSPLLGGDSGFDRALGEVNALRAELGAYKGRLADPTALRECLDLYFRVRLATNKLTLYGNLRFNTYQTSTDIQGMNDRALQAMNQLMAEASFIRGEVLALDDSVVKAAFARESGLSDYRVYVDEMRRRRSRVLGPEAERVLSLAGDNLWAEIDLNELPSDHEKTFNAALSDIPLPSIRDESGEEVQLTFSNYPRYRRSADREVRRGAVEAVFGTLRQYQHVLAATMAGQANTSVFFARARGYETALHAYLDMENIDPAVYRSLIASVRSNLGPLHRYVELRKKVLGLPDVHVYDLYTPLVPSAEKHVTYDESREILLKALAPLGPDYLAVLREGLDPANGWIDVYPHVDKESGAFSAGVYGQHPYVKMNYLDDLDGLQTVAHEYGHALHTYLAMKNQPYPTSDYANFIAEVASTCNEMLLSDYLLKNAVTREEKLGLLNELLESIRTTIYRQTLFEEFELAVHTAAESGTPITAAFLDETYRNLVRNYYGDAFVIGENDGMEWSYVGHFYYKFYMYTYATGLSSGIALAERMRGGDPAAREAYLDMLRAGSSRPPLDLLKSAGVDLTKPEAIEAAARLMDRTITEMEKLLEPK
jgi:oligoendopeptidase F